MNRSVSLPAIAALLGLAVHVGPALAAARTDQPPPLGTQLTLHQVTWVSQGAQMSIQAPQTWRFVLTPEGEARFNAPGVDDVLAMEYRGDGPLRPQLRAEVGRLQGTPGLRVLRAHAHGRGVGGELRYTWQPAEGGTRFVDYVYAGDDAFMVAGRLADRRGLVTLLERAVGTGECS